MLSLSQLVCSMESHKYYEREHVNVMIRAKGGQTYVGMRITYECHKCGKRRIVRTYSWIDMLLAKYTNVQYK